MEQATPYDETLDATLDSAPGPPASATARNPAPAIALVEGSTPRLSSEVDDLLRRRLRSASLMLFAGFLTYLIYRFLGTHQRFNTNLETTILGTHVAMTLMTGIVGWRLCTNCAVILRHLRIAELLVFGGSVVFFVLVSCGILIASAAKGYLMSISPIWLMLIFTYALFIPNTLKRAVIVIGSIALAPIAVMIFLYFTSDVVARQIQTNPDSSGLIIETDILMILAAATAIWGAHTMGSMRRAAFEAKQLGQYRLKQRIGVGGMGEVYLAEHVLLKRPCALKLIRPDKAGDSQALARFEREVKATANLTHWNTIEIYDYGRADDGTFYYVMEYLPGLNLGQLVEMNGPLPAERVIHLLSQTCEALSEAHAKGLIHRDIKPANIFAANRGGVYDVVKLLDFGLAKPTTSVTESALTMAGSITGSPLFMSPEQAVGDDEPDVRSDIYSLGVVAYYLLTGVTPFQHSRPMQVLMSHARDEPVPLSHHHPEVPADLEQVVLRCLEKDRDHRYQDAESLLHALQGCEAAGGWTRETAKCWWENHGCPHKKALDRAVLRSA